MEPALKQLFLDSGLPTLQKKLESKRLLRAEILHLWFEIAAADTIIREVLGKNRDDWDRVSILRERVRHLASAQQAEFAWGAPVWKQCGPPSVPLSNFSTIATPASEAEENHFSHRFGCVFLGSPAWGQKEDGDRRVGSQNFCSRRAYASVRTGGCEFLRGESPCIGR